jgi:hypothetical protein
VPFLRHLDLVLLGLALAVFVAAGFPLEGWAAGAVAWVAQRAIAAYANRRAVAQSDPRRTVGIVTASMIGRGWLVALIILGVGLAFGDDAGLSAAVLFLLVVTVHLTVSLILRPFESNPEQPA